MRLDRKDFLAQAARLGPARKDVVAWVGLAAAYAGLAALSLQVSALPDAIAFSPSTGVVFAAAALWRTRVWPVVPAGGLLAYAVGEAPLRSEEHTSELQSLRHLVC